MKHNMIGQRPQVAEDKLARLFFATYLPWANVVQIYISVHWPGPGPLVATLKLLPFQKSLSVSCSILAYSRKILQESNNNALLSMPCILRKYSFLKNKASELLLCAWYSELT